MKACLLVLLVACTTQNEWEPDFENTRKHAGPARANIGGEEYSFEYNFQDRLVKAGHIVGTEHGPEFEGAEYSYDPAGELLSIVHRSPGQIVGTSYGLLELNADPIEYQVGTGGGFSALAKYDPATFAFLPMVGEDVASPGAELGLISGPDAAGTANATLYTWTSEGSVRTSTSSTGEVATYTFDARDRLIKIEDHKGDFGAARTRTFEYDNEDRLVGRTLLDRAPTALVTEYFYDRGGNVVQSKWTSGVHELIGVYLYDEW